MPSLATSAVAPILGRRIPIPGLPRLLYRSYAKASGQPGETVRHLTSALGDVFDVDLSSFLEWQLWAFGSYEDHLAELFRYLVRPADRCIDVGANIGIHTIRLAKLAGTGGEVIAIEADEQLALRNSSNTSLNGLENVSIIRAAAAEIGGESRVLYRPATQDPNKGRASLTHHAYLTGSQQLVSTVRLDDVNNDPVTLIKIDVEGHEAAVIAGAEKTIEAYSPSIIFEYDPELINDIRPNHFQRLRDHEYSLFQFGRSRIRFSGKGCLDLRLLSALPDGHADVLAIANAQIGKVQSLVRLRRRWPGYLERSHH